MNLPAIFFHLDSITPANMEVLESTERGFQALRILQAWEEMEKGAPPIAQSTPIEHTVKVLRQLRLLNKPLRSHRLLILAVKKQFKELVESLIKCKVNVNACDAKGETAYSQALHYENSEIARLLRAAGADVNALKEGIGGPLNLAIAHRDVAELTALIEAGVNVNRPIRNGMTPLMQAASLDQTERAEMTSRLIEARANLDAVDTAGDTPLHYAVWSTSKERHATASLLCASGCNMYQPDHEDRTAHSLAKEMGDNKMTSIIRMARLVEHMKQGRWDRFPKYLEKLHTMIHQRDFFKRTILMHAAMLGNSAMVRYMMALGASKDVVDNEHHTALYYAEQAGHRDVVLALQYSVSHAMVYQEEWQAPLKELMARDQPLVVVDDLPPLEPFTVQNASKDSSCRDTKFCLLDGLPLVTFHEIGRYITAVDLAKLTASHRIYFYKTQAVWVGHVRKWQQSEIGAPDIAGHMHPTEAKFVYREMRNIDRPLRSIHYLETAIFQGCSTLVAVLTRIKTLVNGCGAYGKTPLIHVCGSIALPEPLDVFSNMVVSLIENGADLNAQDSSGFSAIMHAIKQSSLLRVQLLVGAGASLHIIDNEGMTPLAHAMQNTSVGIAEFLLQVQVERSSGNSAISQSSLRGRIREETASTGQGAKRARRG